MGLLTLRRPEVGPVLLQTEVAPGAAAWDPARVPRSGQCCAEREERSFRSPRGPKDLVDCLASGHGAGPMLEKAVGLPGTGAICVCLQADF